MGTSLSFQHIDVHEPKFIEQELDAQCVKVLFSNQSMRQGFRRLECLT